MHILCIWYGTVQANTAVLSMHERIILFVWMHVAPPVVAKEYFSSSSVVSHAFSALCMYSKFRHHHHLLSYLCTKFCLFHDLHCWASPWRKITYSINQSVTHGAYLKPQEPEVVLWNMYCITKTAEATPRHIFSNDLKFTIYVTLCQISAIPKRAKTVLWHFNTSNDTVPQELLKNWITSMYAAYRAEQMIVKKWNLENFHITAVSVAPKPHSKKLSPKRSLQKPKLQQYV